MDAQELETYEYQLSQIKLSLASDPANPELLSLKTELEDLIALTKQYIGQQQPTSSTPSTSTPSTSIAAPAASSSRTSGSRPSASSSSSAAVAAGSSGSKSKTSFKPGDDCSCRFTDGKWYPARITSISGSADQPVYTVVYKGYQTPEIVTAGDIRSASKWDNGAGDAAAAAAGAGTEKRKAEASQEELEKERKRKKNEKKAETQKAKTEEQGARQKSWQSFAKKGAKKGISIPGMQGESMFRSPEDMKPTAKVGVVGGGRGVTKTAERKRQTFQALGDD
ncbi:hypothetical protein JCM11641_002501 [Rhodosporidiobolus odoratus]